MRTTARHLHCYRRQVLPRMFSVCPRDIPPLQSMHVYRPKACTVPLAFEALTQNDVVEQREGAACGLMDGADDRAPPRLGKPLELVAETERSHGVKA
eukprot:30072-Eustigmatos_ZCMA.PRE.1